MDTVSDRASYLDRTRSSFKRYRRKTETVDWRTKLLRIIVVQAVACLMILLICFGLKSIETPYSPAINNGLNSLLSYSIDIKQSADSVYQTILSYFVQPHQTVPATDTSTAPEQAVVPDGGAVQ